MIIVNPNDNGPRSGESGHHQMADARRRQLRVQRRVSYAREAGLLEAHLSGRTKGKVEQAAKQLYEAMDSGRIGRAQVEEEQRADANRLEGWKAVPPLPGSPHEDEPEIIRYRMAVRARALEMVEAIDLAALTSPTGGYRKPLPATPAAKPWRPGSGLGSSGPSRGGPISRTR
jgi:hypothetical protein